MFWSTCTSDPCFCNTRCAHVADHSPNRGPSRGHTHTRMSIMTRVYIALAVLSACSGLCLAQGPVTISRLQNRQRFQVQDMAVNLTGRAPVVNQNGVQVRQVTVKEMPVLDTLYELERVQHRNIRMQPCSANTPNVAPQHAVYTLGLTGNTSVGVIQNGKGKVLNSVQNERGTFFPPGMVFWEANLDCRPSEVLQVLPTVRGEDIFPEANLLQFSAADIASQFGVSAQEAAALKSAAQANSQGNPLADLLAQCRSRCATNNAPGASTPAGTSAAPANTTRSESANITNTSNNNGNGNINKRPCPGN